MTNDEKKSLLGIGIVGGLLFWGANKINKVRMNPGYETELEKIFGEDFDHAEITVPMSVLEDLGWDFNNDNDYRFFKKEGFGGYTKKELSTYDNFVDASEVNLQIRPDEATYLSNRKGTDWQNADAHVPAGDMRYIIEDLKALKKKGLIPKDQIRENPLVMSIGKGERVYLVTHTDGGRSIVEADSPSQIKNSMLNNIRSIRLAPYYSRYFIDGNPNRRIDAYNIKQARKKAKEMGVDPKKVGMVYKNLTLDQIAVEKWAKGK